MNGSFYRAQKGVAAIWFAMLLVPLMALIFLAIEGTRYIQEKSRLEDATEAAALAITIADNRSKAKSMAEDYVRAYVRDIDAINIKTVRTFQDSKPNIGQEEYVQYSVDARTWQHTWFTSSLIPSFSPEQDIAGHSLAKKYPQYLGDRDVDIVFVSDFSGSMNRSWQGRSQLFWLKNAINRISSNILVPDPDDHIIKNRVAFVPFNMRVQDKINNRLICNTQLRYNNYRSSVSTLDYEEVDWSFWAPYSLNTLKQCRLNSRDCPGYSRTTKHHRREEARRIYDVLSTNSWRLIDHPYYVDYSQTVADAFVNKVDYEQLHYDSSENYLYSQKYNCSRGSDAFWTIGLSSSQSALYRVQQMGANGATAAYQGILRGAQVMAEGRPKSHDPKVLKAYRERLKMILILSDGEESPYRNVLPELVNRGLCDKIRAGFSDSEQPLYIGVVGINFNASHQSGFQRCVVNPDEDIIDVNDVDDLIDKIEELIKKGARSSGITKLYG
ncbi:hypothetical protein ABT56_16330 [Photobacterium aquae]|uniref:TadE-like domain-containing protein n=1 Tax=Photobacterium aquae TaxID=1195763 RepID=A0A0J1GWS3_9GAMM|nr:TadE/TadG family type IV pilus assembly protein [Photobacterium aquae]KLV04173.1 hypothetical protein ABT56_16330 [Photobacterium aquae]